jgi:DNA replication protein DnaC
MPTTAAPADPGGDLAALLVELDLTTLARQIPAVLAGAEKSAPSYSDFLRHALEVERDARAERRIQRRLRNSRLGSAADLKDFDFSARPQLSAQVVRELLGCQFVRERRNVLLVGRPSTGKTTVARALGHAACLAGHSVYYASMTEMLSALRASRADGTSHRAFRRVLRPDLLVLDDAGFATLDKDGANELFHVVCSRHRRASTIVVSNLPFRKWEEFLPSPAQAVAIADRLVDNATVLRFSGKPFRMPRDVHGAPLDGE